MFDSAKFGHTIHLTNREKDEFGLALITPTISRLVGFGEFAVNMSFNVTFDKENTCEGGRFVVDYGVQRSCFYSKEQPRKPHAIVRPAPNTDYVPLDVEPKVLPPPDFTSKPLPWPCPPGSCPCEDDISAEEMATLVSLESTLDIYDEYPTTDQMSAHDCDGISLALITDPAGPGVFIAKDKALYYAGPEKLFAHNKDVTVKLEYVRSEHSEFMKFYLNEVAVTPSIPFTTADLSQGSRIFPKITFVASSSSCPVSHKVSDVWFEMEKVISCATAEKTLEDNANYDLKMLEMLLLLKSETEEGNTFGQESERLQFSRVLTIPGALKLVSSGLAILVILLAILASRKKSNYETLSDTEYFSL